MAAGSAAAAPLGLDDPSIRWRVSLCTLLSRRTAPAKGVLFIRLW